MRAITIFAVVSLGVAFLAGCSAIPATQPAVPVPVPLPDFAFDGSSGSTGAFVKNTIDLTKEPGWILYADRITDYEGVSLSMTAINDTGSSTNPADVQLRFFVSERNDLTAETLDEATPLLTSDLPGGMRTLQYDSGIVPLASGVGRIIRDGHFTLYVSGTPSTISLQTSHAQLELKVRISLL